MDFIITHWAELLLALMAFIKTIINLFPTNGKAMGIFTLFDTIVNAIVPDNKSGGGTHKK